MNEDRILLALSGLLHDIGKFLFKAKEAKGENFELGVKAVDDKLRELKAKREKKKDIYQKEYKYEHAYLSALVFEWLASKGIITEKEKEKLINWGAKHHQPMDNIESVVCQIADWLSSSEREIVLGSCIGLMHSVFERISLKPSEERKLDLKELKEWYTTELNCKKLIEDLSVEHIEPDKKFGYYTPSELKIGRAIFPEVFGGKIFIAKENTDNKYTKKKKEEQKECQYLSFEDTLIVPNKNDFQKARDQEKKYTELFKSFLSELEKAKGLNGIQLFNYIYYLLYKYTWCVPASVFDREKKSRHYPDISLFDHSRVLSAMALSIYDWVKEKGLTSQEIKPRNIDNCWVLRTDGEEVFLLVEGDIGGIQNFIYNIHKTSESELSIAKALRGRSFFLTMLPEVIARYILKKLEYPITNALFIGGGKFQLIVGNTEKNRKRLEEIEDEVNKWFFDAFHGELSLSIATVKVRGCVFRQGGGETFLDKVEQLQLELDNKKKRRFKELIWQEEFKDDQTKAGTICNSCRSLPVFKDNLCQWCYKSQRWGEILPKIKYIAFDFGKERIDLEDRKIIDFGNFGKVYLLEEEDLLKVKNLPEILNMEDTKFKFEKDKIVNGFKFIGHSAPRVEVGDDKLAEDLNKFWNRKKEQSGRSERKEDDLKPGHILPFELLVEFAEGDKKLGFFRADVDYLGLILSDGLRFNEFGTEEIYTISRIATLSRMLDLFFAGYLNKLAEEVSVEYVKKALAKYNSKKNLSDSEKERKKLLEEVYDRDKERLKIGSLIYTVYSGGDDLFVIAPYDLVIEFALKLREEFRKYTCENPDFGISGGIYIGKHNTPIHLVAKFAEDLENKAKKARKVKDMIALFDKALTWSKEIEKWVSEKGLTYCEPEEQEDHSKHKPKYIDLSTIYNKLVSRFVKWLEDKDNGVSRALYYKLLELHRSFVGDSIDPRIYPKIYYYIGRSVKKENVRKEMIETLLNGMNGQCDVEAVIRNLDIVLYLTLMKTRGGR